MKKDMKLKHFKISWYRGQAEDGYPKVTTWKCKKCNVYCHEIANSDDCNRMWCDCTSWSQQIQCPKCKIIEILPEAIRL